MERPDRLRLSSVVCALFIRSVPRKRYFADHPSHFSDGLLASGLWLGESRSFSEGEHSIIDRLKRTAGLLMTKGADPPDS
ncbi:MAG: hypothetical protein KTR25_08640 [Myxococcales bacterium]|nr:hypothetical protein [Myxococcales bacterium]